MGKSNKSLEMVKNVGITPYLNITVGKYNVDSEDLKLLLDYSKNKKYTTLLNIATPAVCGEICMISVLMKKIQII